MWKTGSNVVGALQLPLSGLYLFTQGTQKHLHITIAMTFISLEVR